jgi:hypothetical protein
MTLKLLPRPPFYSLTIDRICSVEDRGEQLNPALEHMEAVVRSILDPESGPKRFCKTVVEDIAGRFYSRCYFGCIGE